MGKTSASAFIAQSLVDAGVRQVYGGHGGALVPLVNAVCDHEELTWVCTRNEANASLMALRSRVEGLCDASAPAAEFVLWACRPSDQDRGAHAVAYHIVCTQCLLTR